MQRVLAMILAGGRGDRLSILSAERAKPAVPFGGKYRIIDFALSNCSNSGIRQVAIVTQYNPRSLVEHIGIGRPWDLDRGFPRGLAWLQPYRSRGAHDWYKGTADAVYQNLAFVEEKQVDQVLILAGDHIYTMDYAEMVTFHRQREADVTIGVIEVPREDAHRFGIVALEEDTGRVIQFEEKPQVPWGNLASMGIYLFNKDVLIEILDEDAGRTVSQHDFGNDVVPHLLSRLNVVSDTLRRYSIFGYRFNGYWQDVGTIESYWQTNMSLLDDSPPLNLYDPAATVYTPTFSDPPTKLGEKAHVKRSLLSFGCVVNGTVENSVLSRRVYVEEGATVRNSIIFSDTIIGKYAVVDGSIIDKQVWVGAGCQIGYSKDHTPNWEEPENLNCGITLVGKGAIVPPGTKVGRNCKIGDSVRISDFSSELIPSGSSVKSRPRRRRRRSQTDRAVVQSLPQDLLRA